MLYFYANFTQEHWPKNEAIYPTMRERLILEIKFPEGAACGPFWDTESLNWLENQISQKDLNDFVESEADLEILNKLLGILLRLEKDAILKYDANVARAINLVERQASLWKKLGFNAASENVVLVRELTNEYLKGNRHQSTQHDAEKALRMYQDREKEQRQQDEERAQWKQKIITDYGLPKSIVNHSFWDNQPVDWKRVHQTLQKTNFADDIGDRSNWSIGTLVAFVGSKAIIKSAIQQNLLNPNKKHNKDRTALHFAAWGGSVEAVQYFIDEVKLDSKQVTNGTTLLHYAGLSCDLGLIKYLIVTKKFDPKQKNNFGLTTLHYVTGSIETIKYLIEVCNLDPNQVDDRGMNALHWAASTSDDVEMVKYLIEVCNMDPTVKDHKGRTAFHIAKWARPSNVCAYLSDHKKLQQIRYQNFCKKLSTDDVTTLETFLHKEISEKDLQELIEKEADLELLNKLLGILLRLEQKAMASNPDQLLTLIQRQSSLWKKLGSNVSPAHVALANKFAQDYLQVIRVDSANNQNQAKALEASAQFNRPGAAEALKTYRQEEADRLSRLLSAQRGNTTAHVKGLQQLSDLGIPQATSHLTTYFANIAEGYYRKATQQPNESKQALSDLRELAKTRTEGVYYLGRVLFEQYQRLNPLQKILSYNLADEARRLFFYIGDGSDPGISYGQGLCLEYGIGVEVNMLQALQSYFFAATYQCAEGLTALKRWSYCDEKKHASLACLANLYQGVRIAQLGDLRDSPENYYNHYFQEAFQISKAEAVAHIVRLKRHFEIPTSLKILMLQLCALNAPEIMPQEVKLALNYLFDAMNKLTLTEDRFYQQLKLLPEQLGGAVVAQYALDLYEDHSVGLEYRAAWLELAYLKLQANKRKADEQLLNLIMVKRDGIPEMMATVAERFSRCNIMQEASVATSSSATSSTSVSPVKVAAAPVVEEISLENRLKNANYPMEKLDDLPEDYFDPITHRLMKNPHMANDGHIYDLTTIEARHNMDAPFNPSIKINKALAIEHIELRYKIMKVVEDQERLNASSVPSAPPLAEEKPIVVATSSATAAPPLHVEQPVIDTAPASTPSVPPSNDHDVQSLIVTAPPAPSAPPMNDDDDDNDSLVKYPVIPPTALPIPAGTARALATSMPFIASDSLYPKVSAATEVIIDRKAQAAL